jgi:hypothetical protein
MKTGCLWAIIAWLGTTVLLFFAAFLIETFLSVRFGGEPFGELIGRIAIFVAFVAFVVGWIRQANRKKTMPSPAPATPTPENLQPIDYSKLSQLYDDDKRPNQPLERTGSRREV